MADQRKISNSITQAQADAEALYAKASSIDPYTAALIKKNAQGNLLSPGVLTSLSNLGVDAKSGVANSIANINAATQEQRLADQKKVAADRETKKFEESGRGQTWKVIKGLSMSAMTTLGTTWNWMTAQGRQGIEGIAQATRSFGISSAAKPLGSVTPGKTEKYIPGAFEQTTAGQIILKSIQDGKKGQFPKLDLGTGFFPSEETGQGYAARQASLAAAKVAIKNSNGDVIGYRPASLFGDTYASIFTLGHPESTAGNVVSLVADIAGSIAFDPGLARAADLKALRKLAAQQRAANAFTDAAKTEDRIAKLAKLEDEALADNNALRKQADELNKIDLESARAAKLEARAARTGAAEDVIKTKQSVKIAQSRLDDFKVIEQREVENLVSAMEARKAVEAVAKAPKQAARTEKLLAAQRKQIEEMTAGRESALARGLTPSVAEEEIASLAEAIKVTEKNLADATALIGKKSIPQEVIDNAIELEKKAKARVKEIKGEVAYVSKQVAERSRTQRLMEDVRERAMDNTVSSLKRERTLSEKLSDATLSLQDKRKSWELAVLRLANAEQTLERPEFAYKNIAEFLTNGRGTKAVDRLVEMTDWKALWRKSDGKLTHEQAQALAAATSPDEVVDILAPYIKRGQIQAGALEPGRLVRMGEKAAERTAFAVPAARRLVGVGAKVQSRIAHHRNLAAFFEGVAGGIKAPITIAKPVLQRGYKTTVKGGTLLNIHDREELLRAVENFGKAADLPKDVLDNLIDEIASAESASRAGYLSSAKLLDAVFNAKAAKMPAHLKDAFEEYTRAFKSSADEMSSYWATRHANGANLKYITLNGESVVLPGPHLDSEFLNSTIYMPPVGELLKLTSKLSKYQTLTKGRDISDKLIGNYWKKLMLVRPAYIVRNIAEEQIRVAAVGHASFFTRPGMALAMWLGKEDGPWTRRLLKQFDTYRNSLLDDFTTGDELLDIQDETLAHGLRNSFAELMGSAKTGADERDFRVLTFKNVNSVGKGHERFFDGIANQLRMLNSSELARVVAGFDPKFVKNAMKDGQFRQEAVIDYFLTGPGRRSLDRFAEGTPDKFRAFIKTPDGLKTYLFTGKDEKGQDISLLARINETTGGNKALQEMVAYGKVNVGGYDLAIPMPAKDAVNSIQNSKAMREGKKALLDEQAILAKDIKKFFNDSGNWDGVLVNVPSKVVAHAEGKAEKFSFVDKFFEISTNLEKNSTFGPEFRQAYWDAINDIATTLDSAAKDKLLKIAEDSLTPLQKAGANVGSKHPVWNAFKSSTGNGPVTLEDAHIYADNYAREHVKNLFYDAHSKRLIFHQLRLIAPFANAWENTVRKWAELGFDNPIGVYKAMKGIEWATKPESSAIYQMTDAQDYADYDQGFFFTDPNSGQRQFFVPFAGTVMASIAKRVTGVDYKGAPMAFSANPMSFNFAFGAGTMLPGIGPGITLPLSALGTFKGNYIDAMPLGIQKWLFPYGRANFSGGLQTAILPGNWNKILGGLTGMEQTYASNFKPVMNYLASGANYNLDNPDDQARLVEDTDTFARWESVMRGVIGLVSPMALIQQGLAKDKDGDTTLQTALYEDFQTMYQANDGDYNKTWFDFLNTYGASQAFALISSSAGEGPANWDSYAFVVSNPDVATKYKDVWGYVMPGGGLSTEMYQWNVSHGLKKQLSPTQILEKVNNQRFYAARDALLSRVDAGEFNRTQYSEALASLKNMMGGGPVVEFDPNARERVLRQLNELVTDERFTDLPSITGLRDYLYLRQDILSKIGKTKFTGAQNEQGARDYLAAQAEWIVGDNPDFQKMFYGFFANELEGK